MRMATQGAWGNYMLVFTCILVHLIGLTTSQPTPVYDNLYDCSGGNYTTNSTYRRNLDAAISTIVSSTDNVSFGFYNISVGQIPDRVYTIALCRGDVEPDICRSCINDFTIRIRERYCPQKKVAVAWFEKCMFRYSDNETIYHNLTLNPIINMNNVQNVTDVTRFNESLGNLLATIKAKALGGDSQLKFATEEAPAPNLGIIYGLVQCTPDLSRQQCSTCLDRLEREIPGCCGGKVGGVILAPSCNLRFEVYSFYNATPSPIAPQQPPWLSPPTGTSPGKDNKARIVIIVVVLVVVSGLIFATICCFILKRKQRKPFEYGDEIGDEALQYDFDTIKMATNQFSDKHKLGQGGFGSVYKGTLQCGEEIAVKRLAPTSGQGEIEFKNEVLLVARLQHRNLVKLRGYCFEGSERLLVYEFMPNASLDRFLFDQEKRAILDWIVRYKIIAGVARGLLYLHEDSRLRIIHRDLKASNVLLDAEMNPKIADFGMARLFKRDETQGDTSRIVGTYGYMAPEYAMHGQFSIKSDVFSFGVLALEIISGQRNKCLKNGEVVEDLLSSTWKCWREGTAEATIDPILRESKASTDDMLRSIHISLLCVQENVATRPTMASVVLMLSSPSLDLPLPSEPAFFMHSAINSQVNSLPIESLVTTDTSHLSKSYGSSSLSMDTSM